MRSTFTYTFAALNISADAYREIRGKLVAAGYEHCFTQSDGHEVIDMHGIAIAPEDEGK